MPWAAVARNELRSPQLRPAATLPDAIASVYEVFSRYRKPRQIDACPCCAEQVNACALLGSPLRDLSAEQLSAYGSKVFLTAGGPDDFGYFLPRLLELSALGRLSWPSPEVLLGTLVLAEWHQWPEREQHAIVSLIHAVVDQAMSLDPPDAAECIDGWLCGMALAGCDPQPAMRIIERDTRILVAYYEQNSASLIKGRLSNSFWSDRPASARPIIAWLNSAPIQELISAHYRHLPGDEP